MARPADVTPTGWQNTTLGELGSFATSGVDKKRVSGESLVCLINYLDVYRERFIDKSTPLMVVSASPNEIAKSQVNIGDVFFTPSSETPDDIGHSAVLVDDLPRTLHSYHTVRFRPHDERSLHLRFRGRVANGIVQLKYFSIRATGSTRYTLSLGDFKTAPVKLPPLAEQARIAEILDTLDIAIHRTEAIIAKLKQVKQGLLHDLLTRGIDANGELRPPQSQAPHLYKSSLLGWIPVGWQVRELVSCVQKIADRDHTTPRYVREGVLMVSPVNLSDDEWIDFEHAKRISARDHAVNRKKTDLEPGDLIIHRIGAGLGQVRLISSKMPTFSILHSMAQIRPNPATMSGRFMLWALRDTRVQVQIEHGTQSIGVPDLGLDKIGALQIVVPELTEQRLISAALNSLQAKIHACNAELHKAKLTKLGLMDDLLTGRVRVTPLLDSGAA